MNHKEADPPNSFPQRLLNEDEAAKILSLSTRTLQNLRLNGGGPAYVKLTTRRIAYNPKSLAEWAESRTKTSTSDCRRDLGQKQ